MASVKSTTTWIANSGQNIEYDQWSPGLRLDGGSYNNTINQTYQSIYLQEDNDAAMVSALVPPVVESPEVPQVTTIRHPGGRVSYTNVVFVNQTQ